MSSLKLDANDRKAIKALEAFMENWDTLPADILTVAEMFLAAGKEFVDHDKWAQQRSNDQGTQEFRAFRSLSFVYARTIIEQNAKIKELQGRIQALEDRQCEG